MTGANILLDGARHYAPIKRTVSGSVCKPKACWVDTLATALHFTFKKYLLQLENKAFVSLISAVLLPNKKNKEVSYKSWNKKGLGKYVLELIFRREQHAILAYKIVFPRCSKINPPLSFCLFGWHILFGYDFIKAAWVTYKNVFS